VGRRTAIQRINYLHLLTNSCLMFGGCCSPTSYDSCVVESPLCCRLPFEDDDGQMLLLSSFSSQALVSAFSFFSLKLPHHNKGSKGTIPFLTIGQQGDIWGQKGEGRER